MSHDPYAAPPARSTPAATWAVLAHLGGILAYFFVGWVTALAVWLAHRGKDHGVAHQALVALNFQLTVLVALVAARILAEFPLIGFVGWIAMVAIGVASLVLSVLAAVAVSGGGTYRYPVTLDLVR